MTKHCRSCDRTLTIEHLITDKLGGYALSICLECIIAAFEEVLREDKHSTTALSVNPSSESVSA